jgi:hypothetical protein
MGIGGGLILLVLSLLFGQNLFDGTGAPGPTSTTADGSVAPGKYLAYWARQQDGWRLLAYKRTSAKAAPPSIELGYVLPTQIVTTKADSAAIERNRESLAEAERSFSRDAQTIGIGPAFKQYGSPDAINLGGPDAVTFVMGNDAIGNQVGSGAPPNASPVNWGPEKTIIADSGDFGSNISIRQFIRFALGHIEHIYFARGQALGVCAGKLVGYGSILAVDQLLPLVLFVGRLQLVGCCGHNGDRDLGTSCAQRR